MARRTWVFVVALIVVAAAVVYAMHYFSDAAVHPSTDDAYVQGDTVLVSAKIAGRVLRVSVQGSERVAQGQVLVELDPTDARIAAEQDLAAIRAAEANVAQARAALVTQQSQTAASVAQANATLAAADAHVPQTQTTVAIQERTLRQAVLQAEAQLSAAQGQAVSARSALATAQRTLSRDKTLLAQGAVAQQDVDQAQAAYDAAVAQDRGARDAVTQARAALASAEANQMQVEISRQDITGALAQRRQAQAGVASAQTGFDVTRERQAQLASAEAAVAQAQAQLAAVQEQLQDTRIVASVDGVVANQVPVQPGQVVQPGQTLLTIVRLHKWVEANFKETQLTRVRVGQPATVRVDLLRQTFHGRVERLGPATGAALSLLPPQNATGNFTKVVQRVPIRIALDDAPTDLQLGLSVEVTIDTTRNLATNAAR
ncbi:MAG TPA: HlyD family efflux transporter periplasmic adaptor subunit [bacterium]|nr:HlyD family efflux transporter periplasmic adaptor subunit [bacterium]